MPRTPSSDFPAAISPRRECNLVAAVAEHRRPRWLDENKEAIAAWNDHVVAHRLPLAAYRQF